METEEANTEEANTEVKEEEEVDNMEEVCHKDKCQWLANNKCHHKDILLI
jgi:hypothetical protein